VSPLAWRGYVMSFHARLSRETPFTLGEMTERLSVGMR